MHKLGKWDGARAAKVNRSLRASYDAASGLGMYATKMLSVTAGGDLEVGFTVFVTSNGVLTCGGSDRIGGSMLGHGGGIRSENRYPPRSNVYAPKLVRSLLGKHVVGVSGGGSHTAVWTKEGELFTFGEGWRGQLGHGGRPAFASEADTPKLVEALAGKKVIGASAGLNHTAAWTEEGELYTFGEAADGKLGYTYFPDSDEHGYERGGYNFDALSEDMSDILRRKQQHVPRLVESYLWTGKKVVGASAGMSATVAWTDGGELFTFGRTPGLGYDYGPTLVGGLVGNKVVGASVGGGYVAVWTEAGEFFTYGGRDDGRMGHGSTQVSTDATDQYGNVILPTLVKALEGKKVASAATGVYHTVVCTDAGELFTFGGGQHGELGHGGNPREPVPRLVEALLGKKVIGVSASREHTVVWTEGNEVFTFGNGCFGQLGHGGKASGAVPRLVEACC